VNNIFEVNGEHHWVLTCPCQECEQERKRRDLLKIPLDPHVLIVSSDAAYLLGLIPTRCSSGSLARELMLESASGAVEKES